MPPVIKQEKVDFSTPPGGNYFQNEVVHMEMDVGPDWLAQKTHADQLFESANINVNQRSFDSSSVNADMQNELNVIQQFHPQVYDYKNNQASQCDPQMQGPSAHNWNQSIYSFEESKKTVERGLEAIWSKINMSW